MGGFSIIGGSSGISGTGDDNTSMRQDRNLEEEEEMKRLTWNTNFGRFKYEDSAINFLYETAYLPNGRARAQSTKKFNVVLDLTSTSIPPIDSRLGEYLSYVVLPLSSQSRLSGKVELMNVLKKEEIHRYILHHGS